MSLAKTLMIQGTASTVGKSTLVTGLCRIFAQEGYRVAPFKAQNMSLNAAVTSSGGEIGRAQATQAEAAGIEPTVEMNPILLKPQGPSRSQVIVMGRPLAAMEAQEYYQRRTGFVEYIQQALTTLRQAYDLVIIEGAGSPVELNLAHYDLVNMRVAQLADAPVLLVGDIDQGGIFAAMLGTLMLLQPEERARVKGLIVNKFRGDLALWHDGERLLAERSGIPVLGTVPHIEQLRIAEEDSVALDTGVATVLQGQQRKAGAQLDIVLLRFPYMSNYDEFDALAADPQVRLHVVARAQDFPAHPDLIILPGTKNTLHDLAWLWRAGLAQQIRQYKGEGSAILGICGGYQMLSEQLHDPAGVEAEAGTIDTGLGLLPLTTVFQLVHEKVTQRCQAWITPAARRGLFAHLTEQAMHVYQIHVGRTTVDATSSIGKDVHGTWGALRVDTTQELEGYLSADGWCAGCYLHGLFENNHIRHGIIQALRKRQSPELAHAAEQLHFSRQHEYDRLAATLRQHLDLHAIQALLQ
ncbi:cobyric acid synthase [Ktedonobacteria bacterium brp13]|nr:cobyric acid synthase [Ktedonobacteria bacterium brp13]